MFSDRFETLCREKGVRPGRACSEMGVSRSLAAKWKSTGTEKPSADVLEKMSLYFQCSIDEILGHYKAPTPKGERNVIKIAGRDGSFVEKNLSDAQIAAVKALVAALPDVGSL